MQLRFKTALLSARPPTAGAGSNFRDSANYQLARLLAIGRHDVPVPNAYIGYYFS